jgi:hypothetical protein
MIAIVAAKTRPQMALRVGGQRVLCLVGFVEIADLSV